MRIRAEEENCRSRASAGEAGATHAGDDAGIPGDGAVGDVGGRRCERLVAAERARRRGTEQGLGHAGLLFSNRVAWYDVAGVHVLRGTAAVYERVLFVLRLFEACVLSPLPCICYESGATIVCVGRAWLASSYAVTRRQVLFLLRQHHVVASQAPTRGGETSCLLTERVVFVFGPCTWR